MGKNTGWLGMAMLLGLLAACGGDGGKGATTGKVVDAGFLADNATWREQRKNELVAPDGWTSLVGLHWIELKSHFLGSGPASGIKLAVGPAKMGMLSQQEGRIFFTPERAVCQRKDRPFPPFDQLVEALDVAVHGPGDELFVGRYHPIKCVTRSHYCLRLRARSESRSVAGVTRKASAWPA